MDKKDSLSKHVNKDYSDIENYIRTQDILSVNIQTLEGYLKVEEYKALNNRLLSLLKKSFEDLVSEL